MLVAAEFLSNMMMLWRGLVYKLFEGGTTRNHEAPRNDLSLSLSPSLSLSAEIATCHLVVFSY